MKALKLLVDRNIENHALRAEGAIQTQTLQWGPHTVTNDVHGYRAKELPKDKWLRRQIESLPTIARMSRDGEIVLYTSVELKFEAFNASRGWQGYVGDLFRDIKFEDVPAAIERSYFWQTEDLATYSSGVGQAGWYKDFLLKIDEHKMLAAFDEHRPLPNFDRANLLNLGRYREICANLDTDDHIRDAFHLWTAEANKLDFFLTADKKFINKMTLSTKIDLPTPPICPEALLEHLGVSEPDPMPLSGREFRNLLQSDE